MKPTLTHQPNASYAYEGIKIRFANGAPLSADQYNFLYRHEKSFNGQLDPAIKYYLKSYYQKAQASFLFHGNELNQAGAQQLKKRLEALVAEKHEHLSFQLTQEAFLDLRKATVNELILYHGNQFLTGAPFEPGGIPYTLFFQWGNLFGVVKYQVLPDEKELMGNVLISVEDKAERLIEEFVNTYKATHQPAPMPAKQNTPELTQKVAPTLVQAPTPVQTPAPVQAPAFKSPFTLPKLTLARFQSTDEQKSK